MLKAGKLDTAKGIASIALSAALVVSFVPLAPARAYAAQDEYSAPAAMLEGGGAEVTGGDVIDADGDYVLATGATGTITIAEELDVKLIGRGSAETFSNLNVIISDGSTLTIEDLYASQTFYGTSTSDMKSTFDFLGNGAFNIEGVNVIDANYGSVAPSYTGAVIKVSKGNEVHFGGEGMLYGYKSALSCYIGGGVYEANGKIVFDGGHWFLKGTKTGSIIGGDSVTEYGDDVVINAGEIYCKGVARGALIGGSNYGKAGNVVMNGGLVELYEDFTGPAIGAGNPEYAAAVTVKGGSLKTTMSSNSKNSYGGGADFNGLPVVDWSAVKATNASDYALLTFDVSKYITDLREDTVTLYVDGGETPFYSGRAYNYVTNEVKNPKDITGTTMDNWLSNEEKWLVSVNDYPITDPATGARDAYPNKNGSSMVVDMNLYLPLSKETHTVTVGKDSYTYNWDAQAGKFVPAAPAPEPVAGILGDINNDDLVGIVDAQVVLDLANGVYGTAWTKVCACFGKDVVKSQVFWVADINEDKVIDALDARAIQTCSLNEGWQ